MPRKMKRVTQSRKKTSKKPKVSQAKLTLAETMEKDFKSAPIKLMTQFSKDLTTFKQQEKKLSTDLKKAKKKASSKPTHKASERKLNKIISDLSIKLEHVLEKTKILAQKKAKFETLSKQLLALEKQLEKSSKLVKVSKATKKSKKLASSVTQNMTVEIPNEIVEHSPEVSSSISSTDPVESSS